MTDDTIQIITVGEAFSLKLNRPEYQRPYEWEAKHITTLLDDLLNFQSENANRYRLGSILLHERKTETETILDIVDGQQRLITLWLIKSYLQSLTNKFSDNDSIGQFELADKTNYNPQEESRSTINNACVAIYNWFRCHSEEDRSFIKQMLEASDDVDETVKRAQLVVIKVYKIEEAFQLFDSQNSRGKALKIHNYLKARHLGQMSEESRNNIKKYRLLDDWIDDNDSKKITHILNRIFKIIEWSHLQAHTALTIENMDRFFYGFTDSDLEYQKHYISQKDFFEIGRPFKAGEDFFWMMKHFRIINEQVENCCNDYIKRCLKPDENKNKETNQNNEWHNDRLKSITNLFFTAALLYSNRFGFGNLNKNISSLFAWAFTLRLVYSSLRLTAIEDFAIGSKNQAQTYGFLEIPWFARMSYDLTPEFINVMRQSSYNVLNHINDVKNINKPERSNKDKQFGHIENNNKFGCLKQKIENIIQNKTQKND